MRSSAGAGQAAFNGEREVNASDVAVPSGYRVEVVATGLTFPTGIAFGEDRSVVVTESGYSYGEVFTEPRLLRITEGGDVQVMARGSGGPWTGVTYHDGNYYVASGDVRADGKILRIQPDGATDVVVDGLPSRGDHHTNGPVVGPDGWLYFAQGTATNSGVVGKDNAAFGWLERYPEFHDVPGADIVLAGLNYESSDALASGSSARLTTGAYLPFGTPSTPGQTIQGRVKCTGSVLRVRPEGGEPELVAWGLRNPFGLAFDSDGQLFVTENGADNRGSRPLWGAPDVLWAIEPGTWYGWPDFVAGEPVTEERYSPLGSEPTKFLLAEHPQQPPEPKARFPVHSSADGFDFSRSTAFGHVGQAFVALFGDEAPTTGKVLSSVGCKVVRVDVETGVIEDFAVNRGPVSGPASKIGGGGLERPVAARFSPDGQALYLVDFGVMMQDREGAKPARGTGTIWRIVRTEE